jgi:hypothetical protein
MLVDHLRGTLHVDNVLVADVANYAEHADGLVLLTDAAGGRGIVYGIHPYTYDPSGLGVANSFAACEGAYATRWQYLPAMKSRAVLITEWHYIPSDCGGENQEYAPQFLGYVSGGITATSDNTHHVGLLAHAGDVQNNVILDWNMDGTISPTTCPMTPAGWGKGPGVDVQAYYAALVAAGY